MATDKQLLEQLKDAGVISEGKLYRMRLFSFQERHVLRHALMDAGKVHDRPSYLPVEGGSYMMDELEMVNFQCYGLEEVKRSI